MEVSGDLQESASSVFDAGEGATFEFEVVTYDTSGRYFSLDFGDFTIGVSHDDVRFWKSERLGD